MHLIQFPAAAAVLLPHVESDLSRIYHFSDPRLPQFAFEWHPRTQKVYRIDIPGRWIDGVFVQDTEQRTAKGFCVAEHQNTHAGAFGAVQTFCRGYIKALCDRDRGELGGRVAERITATDSCPIR